MPKKLRIFIGLREMAGYFKGLKSGFDDLGVHSVFMDISGQPFSYEIKNNPKWITVLNNFCQKVSRFSFKSIILRLLWLGVIQNFISLFLFPWAFFAHNVFIFSSNSTFFFYLELPLLKLARKKIIYVFLGTESRPLYMSANANIKNRRTIYLSILLTKVQKVIVNYIEKFSNYVVSIHPQAIFHKKPFISVLVVGFPRDVDQENFKPLEAKAKPRILHAPSRRATKGSDIFRMIINQMQSNGLEFDYKEISGVTNKEVLFEISQSDFVIDELYSDTPLAGFSTEAAFLGRPAVIGSYYSEYLRKDIPARFIPPSMFYHPEKIYEAIEKLIIDSDFRRDLGKKAHDFVINNWNPKHVAENYICLINNNHPNEWLFDPYKIEYIYGTGIKKENFIKNLKAFYKVGGSKAFCLNDKPELLNRILKLVNEP